jgi:arsenite oxidase small subunit
MSENGGKSLRTFSKAELDKSDGKEGRPLYIVFKGDIYDLSKSRLWLQGKHMGIHIYTENLEETIKAAPHRDEVLGRFPIIGRLAEEPAPIPQAAAVPLVSEVEKPTEPPPEHLTMNRRKFLKLAAAGGGAVTVLALLSSIKAVTFVPSGTTPTAWPKLTVTKLASLETLTPVIFNYPLTNTPNFLVKLGVKPGVTVKNGIGPDNDVVAFSGICQHLGCYYGFVPPGSSPPCNKGFEASRSQGYCCCHGSQYDFTNGAAVIGGPAPRPVPQVTLEYDSSGNINAVSMGPPTIFGHGPPGTTDPALVLQYDLQGGQVVSSS